MPPDGGTSLWSLAVYQSPHVHMGAQLDSWQECFSVAYPSNLDERPHPCLGAAPALNSSHLGQPPVSRPNTGPPQVCTASTSTSGSALVRPRRIASALYVAMFTPRVVSAATLALMWLLLMQFGFEYVYMGMGGVRLISFEGY